LTDSIEVPSSHIGEIKAFMTLDGPKRSGWWSALVEIEYGALTAGNKETDAVDILPDASKALRERGFYRPHDNWEDWEEINTTYMRKRSRYYQLKVRKRREK